MREFMIRIGVLLPIAVFGVFVLMVVIGGVANGLGATSLFYCSVYCKIGLSLLVATVAALLYCQAKACFRKQ
jgi:hypothetical protein